MKERNTSGPTRVRAEETTGTGAGGMTETGVEGMAETSTEGIVETGAIGAAREVAVGIFVSAATLGSSKVFAIRRMDMQNKGRPQ